jgi:two-component system, LytTR family, response regulator
MSFRILVVDDEPLARVGVTARLRAHEDMLVVGECSTGEEALQSISRLAPDLVFLDIQMPGISGLELLRLLSRDRAPCFILLTAHEDYAVEAFEVEALDYLLKPIDDLRFAASLERARRVLNFRQQEALNKSLRGVPDGDAERANRGPVKRFVVRNGNEVTFVRVSDVDYIEGQGDYLGLHVGGKMHLVRGSLTALESRLDRAQFLRVHRSIIIQIDRIVRVEPATNRDYLVTLRDKSTIRASRTYSQALKDILQNKITD